VVNIRAFPEWVYLEKGVAMNTLTGGITVTQKKFKLNAVSCAEQTTD